MHHAAGQVDGYGEDAATGVGPGNRQTGEVVIGVGVLLEAVHVDGLAKVAGAVEEAHADEREAEVGGGLAVVAGEDAETTQ